MIEILNLRIRSFWQGRGTERKNIFSRSLCLKCLDLAPHLVRHHVEHLHHHWQDVHPSHLHLPWLHIHRQRFRLHDDELQNKLNWECWAVSVYCVMWAMCVYTGLSVNIHKVLSNLWQRHHPLTEYCCHVYTNIIKLFSIIGHELWFLAATAILEVQKFRSPITKYVWNIDYMDIMDTMDDMNTMDNIYYIIYMGYIYVYVCYIILW